MSLAGLQISYRANNQPSVTSKEGKKTCLMRNTAMPALGASLNRCESSGRGNTLSLVVKFVHDSKIVLTITLGETYFACNFLGKLISQFCTPQTQTLVPLV